MSSEVPRGGHARGGNRNQSRGGQQGRGGQQQGRGREHRQGRGGGGHQQGRGGGGHQQGRGGGGHQQGRGWYQQGQGGQELQGGLPPTPGVPSGVLRSGQHHNQKLAEEASAGASQAGNVARIPDRTEPHRTVQYHKPAEGSTRTTPEVSQELSKLSLLDRCKSSKGSHAVPYASLEERMRHVGTLGRQVKLQTNHFDMALRADLTVFQYTIECSFANIKREIRKKDYPVLFGAFEKIKKDNPDVFKTKFVAIIDPPSNIYSACRLNFKGKTEFEVEVRETADIEDVMVKIKFVIKEEPSFCEITLSGNTDQQSKINSVLNLIFGYSTRLPEDLCKEYCQTQFVTVGKNAFKALNTIKGKMKQLSDGKFLWLGSFLSTRMGWKVRLNIDMACKPAYGEGELADFCLGFLHLRKVGELEQLQSRDLDALSRELFGLKVRFIRPDGHIRDSRVVRLLRTNADTTTFESGEGAASKKMSVSAFFKETYKKSLIHPKLPLVHVGNKNKTVYWPMELVLLKSQACPVTKGLTSQQTADIIKFAAKRPVERKEEIEKCLLDLNSCFQEDNFCKAFGLSVDGKMLTVKGRLLTPPVLAYKGNHVTPDLGKWIAKGQFNNPMKLEKWAIIDLHQLLGPNKPDLVKILTDEARKFGLIISSPLKVKASSPRGNSLENDFKEIVSENKDLQLIMVLMKFKDSHIYGRVKVLGDCIYNKPTQVLLERSIGRCNSTLAHNICLKLNSKLGGTNQRLAEIPTILQKPVMLMGADVTHSSPGEGKPSIAAVVGSADPEALSVYHCLVSVQERTGAHSEERILKLQEMTKKLLLKFYNTSKQKPQKIIYFRDGVSDGQFEQILNSEISAIQGACKSLNPNYEPGITFVVVQKRHHTRFFPENPKEAVKSGNILPGTVVDELITHPTQQSYFLASHEGIQGTTKPAHYHLLYDDNNLSANELQQLSFYLCHLYSRCERSVSYPAPTYYAHLCAFRARYHHNLLIERGKDQDQEELRKMEEMKIPNYFV